ncbi:hypothetical protein BH10PSE7_BH10PSE7_22260 [soil metagenome]
MGPDTANALIGAIGTIAAAFIGVLTWYLASRADRRREEAERQIQIARDIEARDQRVLDVVVALHSEILAGTLANRRQLTESEAQYALHQVTPFATADETDFVFDAVRADITILPAQVIHSVVQYYRAARQSNLLTRDLRDPYFLTQTPDEKRRIISMLLQIVELQKILGEAAIIDLAEFASQYGIDLKRNEERATGLMDQARADISRVFKKLEQSDRASNSPSDSEQP